VSSVRRVLAISPHLDDAALSVGATLAGFSMRGADVKVLTLFAGVPHEPLTDVARAFHAKCGLPEDASAVAVRRDEDRAAMHELGAHAHHGEFLDAVYRRAPDGQWLCQHDQAMFDAQPLDEDLLDDLSSEVRHALHTVDPDLVLTCAAVGDHIDHRLTRAAVLHAATSTTTPILLWEDLPYAIGDPPVTTPHPTRPITAEAWKQKRRGIARYTTQVRMLWPTNTDWAAQLVAHAHTRGHGCPAELLFPPKHGAPNSRDPAGNNSQGELLLDRRTPDAAQCQKDTTPGTGTDHPPTPNPPQHPVRGRSTA
jgi:LmbE family N-acetylglucosaminyl deacetylase